MTAIAKTNTDLRWDVLTVKRPGLTRDLPPGKEETDVGGEFVDAHPG